VTPAAPDPQPETAPREVARASGIPAAAALLAASVLFSRLIGVVRESVLAYRVGADRSSDAYFAAFQIPDLLNYLLAGAALSIAFLPIYTRKRSTDPAAAEALFAMVLGNLGAVVTFATVILMAFAPALVAFQFRAFDAETQALCTRLTRIVLPAQICFVIGGIVQTTLLARGRFRAVALAPLIYNLGIVLGGLALAPLLGVEGFAWGALAGAVCGPLAVPLLDARGRVPLRVRFAPRDRDFLSYLWIAAPLMFGQSLLTVDEWFDRWFGAALGVGVVAHLAFSRRLMQAPVAFVGQAIGAAALPALARLFAENRTEELNRAVETTLRATLGLGILAAAGTMVVAGPLVEVVYQRGAFGSDDTARVVGLLAIFAWAVPAWVTQQVASRAFYARGDTWRPMLLATLFTLVAIPLYWQLGRRHGAAGLAAAGVVAMTANALATLGLARVLHGAPRGRALAASTLRGVVIAAAAAAATREVLRAAKLEHALLELVLAGAVFGVVAALGALRFGDRELREGVTRRLRRRARGA